MDPMMFSALAEPNRLRIVELLRDRPASVNEVANRVNLRQPQASKHLQALKLAGWVTVRPLAQQRIYVLRPEAFMELGAWLTSFERHWVGRFGKLDSYLERLKER
jgi:DNA-binding transcriptional ArsR family regulator